MKNQFTPQHRKRYLKTSGKTMLLLATAFLMLCAFNSTASAGYAIELKSGSTFVTNWYWESGGVVRFHAFGGVIGFDRGAIQSIKEVALELPAQPVPAVSSEKEPAPKKEGKQTGVKTFSKTAEKEAQTVPKTAEKGEKSKERIDIEKEIAHLRQEAKRAWAEFEDLPEAAPKKLRDEARQKAYAIDQKIVTTLQKLK